MLYLYSISSNLKSKQENIYTQLDYLYTIVDDKNRGFVVNLLMTINDHLISIMTQNDDQKSIIYVI